MPIADPFRARETLETPQGPLTLYRLSALERAGLCRLARLPYSIRVLLEAVLRHSGRGLVSEAHVRELAGWSPERKPDFEVPFMPSRVLMQDFTGVPAVVDLAAMRGAMGRLGGDPKRINPLIPTDLVIDHSVQVDFYGRPDSLARNEQREFERNRERYEFLRWGREAFDNFRVVPPSTGIVHQVNLEYLARVVQVRDENGERVAMPDTLVGTDSHTTMINGLGVLGWGVGGIEAEAAMLGQPYYMVAPEVVGMRLEGRLGEGVTATDLVLHITQLLRRHGVVGKFVEFHGPGMRELRLADRATLANMAPEYGATMGFFPVDDKTLEYLSLTGRSADHIAMVERYLREQGLFVTDESPHPEYSALLTLDLGEVTANLAGPKRPHDRVSLSAMQDTFRKALTAPASERGFALSQADTGRTAEVKTDAGSDTVGHGSVVIAAITSCTNTSNPSVLIAAGLLARNAVQRGLRVPVYVKTSLAPGSRVVTDYLQHSGLMADLERLGFSVVGYGCTTCIGNSGPLDDAVARPVQENDLVVASVLSGNRNFEGRINPLVKANYLASPPLVVAYALAGTVDRDLTREPLGEGPEGPVYLRDLWPGQAEIERVVQAHVTPEMFSERYANVFAGNETWNAIRVEGSELYPWDLASTYIQEPPFFEGLQPRPEPVTDIRGARVLAMLGDSVTTDHISPAGAIPPESPAGEYLIESGVPVREFNSFGSRRGNDRVMTRGTFGNIRIRNQLAPGTEGGYTVHLPHGEPMSIYAAAMKYQAEGVPLLVIGGKEYGSGSSRDWAAKGTRLLGVRAVLVESYERIHRSNLVGMGVLPLQFRPGENRESLGLTGREAFDIEGLAGLEPGQELQVTARGDDGAPRSFSVLCRIDTRVEAEYYRQGGILQTVLRQLAGTGAAS